MSEMLELRHISKTFGAGTINEKKAVEDLSLTLASLTLRDGDFVSVIGGNGAGKSTLFNAVAGVFYVDEGRVILDGEDMTFLPEYKRSNHLGRLFQDPLKGTAPHMTIEENLALAYLRSVRTRSPFGTVSKKDREYFRERLAALGLGLEDRLKSPVGLLSGGQRQALTLLMATLVTPKLLLLDEHTAALDPKTAAKVLLCIVLVLGLAFGGIYWYVGSIFNTGEMGSLAPPESGADALVPDELSGTMNILVLGIDYSTEDAVKRDPIGQTDMILYVRVNGSDHTMTMLQIPRDTLVGEIGGSAGKINGIFANSADKENRVNTLAQYITKVFGLPIDDYVTIDMDSLREIVDVFGGIEVYVPVTMEYDGSRLEQGWRVLMGAECEFFLRQRKDTSATPRGDIDRLANQQYFYSALFRRVRTATVGDIIKLTPVVQKYINTSLNFMELVQLGMSVLSIPTENIIIGRLPVARGELYNGQDVMVCAKAETAEFLNEYFRPADDPLAAQQIGTPDWGTRSEVIGAEVRRMGEVDAVGGSDANAPADAQQAAQQANAASVQQPAA